MNILKPAYLIADSLRQCYFLKEQL